MDILSFAKNGKIIHNFLFFFIIAVGAALRFRNLGGFGFWWDELYHVSAAKSLISGHGYFIPLIGDYTRAYPFTQVVALFFKSFGVSEVTARIPGVFSNLLLMVSGYWIIRRWFSKNIALLWMICICFSPLEIELSRECRMYAPFQFIFFLASYCFYLAFENKNRSGMVIKSLEERYQISFLYGILCLVLFVISYLLHALTLNFLVVIVVYCLVMFFVNFFTKEERSIFDNKYFYTLFLAGASFVALKMFQPFVLEKAIELAHDSPDWWRLETNSYNFYRQYFSVNYPALTFLIPLSCLFMIKREGKKGTFIISVFATLFLLHSFVFVRQHERYLFYAFPYFFLIGIYFVNIIIEFVLKLIKSEFEGRPQIVGVVVILSALIAFNSVGYPWIGNSKNVSQETRWNQWIDFPQKIKEDIKGSTFLTTRIMASMYYIGVTPDWCLRVAEDEYRAVDDPRHNIGVIRNVNTLKKIFDETPGEIYLVATNWTFHEETIISSDSRDFIERNMRRIDLGAFEKAIVFKRDAQ